MADMGLWGCLGKGEWRGRLRAGCGLRKVEENRGLKVLTVTETMVEDCQVANCWKDTERGRETEKERER